MVQPQMDQGVEADFVDFAGADLLVHEVLDAKLALRIVIPVHLKGLQEERDGKDDILFCQVTRVQDRNGDVEFAFELQVKGALECGEEGGTP